MNKNDIRRAGPDDAGLVREMLGELADYQDEGEFVQVTVDHWRELLDRDDVIVLLAERDGEGMGYVSALRRPYLWTGGDVLALDDLYVRKEFRDSGVGRELMIELARYVQPDGHHHLGDAPRERARPTVLRPPRSPPAYEGRRGLGPGVVRRPGRLALTANRPHSRRTT